MNDTEKIIAGDRADLLRVLSQMPNSGPDYVRRLTGYWEAEAERLAGLRVCISLQDLYRLRARELRRAFLSLSDNQKPSGASL